jgi:hypothetical protein
LKLEKLIAVVRYKVVVRYNVEVDRCGTRYGTYNGTVLEVLGTYLPTYLQSTGTRAVPMSQALEYRTGTIQCNSGHRLPYRLQLWSSPGQNCLVGHYTGWALGGYNRTWA